MQKMAGMNKLQQMRAIKQMADGGMFDPNAALQMRKKDRSARGPIDKRAEQDKKKRLRKEAKKQRKKNRR